MKFYKLIFLCLVIFFTNKIAAQDNKARYEDLLKSEKYDELLEHLKQWEQSEPQNPEMFIAYFNYYIQTGSEYGISVDKEKNDKGTSLEINDQESGDTVGFIQNSVVYDSEKIKKGVEYLDRGLKIAPQRLDMRFGKIYILNEIEDYNAAGKEFVATIEISKTIKNNWLWSNNETLENGESFFLNNLQDYYSLWISKNKEDSLEQVKLCAVKQVELYPQNIYAYNNLAIYYSLKEQLDDALKYFLEAEKINGNDCIVLVNIGLVYVNKGEKEKAKNYFEKVLSLGTDDEKEYAQYYLDKIK